MSAPHTKELLLKAIPSLTEVSLLQVRKGWHKGNEMRQIINALSDSQIEAHRNALETCKAEELPILQGRISGIRAFTAIINAEGDV